MVSLAAFRRRRTARSHIVTDPRPRERLGKEQQLEPLTPRRLFIVFHLRDSLAASKTMDRLPCDAAIGLELHDVVPTVLISRHPDLPENTSHYFSEELDWDDHNHWLPISHYNKCWSQIDKKSYNNLLATGNFQDEVFVPLDERALTRYMTSEQESLCRTLLERSGVIRFRRLDYDQEKSAAACINKSVSEAEEGSCSRWMKTIWARLRKFRRKRKRGGRTAERARRSERYSRADNDSFML